jgi:LysR family glycine cleavage system transcriptional activator
VERLCSEQLFPVCSPKLLEGARRLREPADIAKFPLLHLDGRQDWSMWLEAAGISSPDVSYGPIMNRASMLIDAAIDGQGIALARSALAAWDLLNGRLVRPFAEALPLSKSYWIVCPKATSMLPKISRARDWLLAEAADDIRRLKELAG